MMLRRTIGLLVLLAWGSGVVSSASACTDRRDPLASPTAGVELRFGNRQSVGVGVDRQRSLPDDRLALPGVRPSVQDIQRGVFDKWGGSVVFIEPDGKGGKRVCRVENWQSRSIQTYARRAQVEEPEFRVDDDGVVRAIPYEPTPAQERNPVLAKLLPHYFMNDVVAYYYDASNHLVEVDEYMSTEVNSVYREYPAIVTPRWLLYCFNYRDGRLESSARFAENVIGDHPEFSCDQLAEAGVSYDSYRYNADGTVLANLSHFKVKSELEGSSRAGGRAGGTGNVWLSPVSGGKRVGVFLNFSVANSLTYFDTQYMDLFNADAQPLYEERSKEGRAELKYSFPVQPVPLSVIDSKFVNIDRYPRIRRYPHRSGMVIWEFFDASARTPRQRQWRALDVSRQEIYGANGKLTRVIHFGSASPDAYKEDLRPYAESGVLKVTPTTSGYASYRVYDYNAQGKESLVFVCWQHDEPSNRPLLHFPWWTPDPAPKRGNEEALIYGMTMVANRCGTPDGKMLVEGLSPIKKYMAATYGYDVEKLSFDEKR